VNDIFNDWNKRVNESELLPCPYCGGEGYVAHRTLSSGTKWYGCGCKRCRVQFGCYNDSEKEAIEQWNKRVKE
jgi:Lar family restriction alleviation protein